MMLTSSRTTNILLVAMISVGIGIVAMLASGVRGGPLDPPGPVGSTDGVQRPGTPISSLPYPITQSGYYYVTRNLTGGAGQGGITIASSNVTLDLGGFTLIGGTNPLDGISANGPRYAVIRNGNVRGWSTGIKLVSTYSRVEHVTASNNSSAGINIIGESVVSDCMATINTFIGIVVTDGTVRNCTVAENSRGIVVGDDSLLEGNRVSVNSGAGVEVGGSRNRIANNQLAGNSPATDLYLIGGVTFNVITGNVYCTDSPGGTFTTYVGNYC